MVDPTSHSSPRSLRNCRVPHATGGSFRLSPRSASCQTNPGPIRTLLFAECSPCHKRQATGWPFITSVLSPPFFSLALPISPTYPENNRYVYPERPRHTREAFRIGASPVVEPFDPSRSPTPALSRIPQFASLPAASRICFGMLCDDKLHFEFKYIHTTGIRAQIYASDFKTDIRNLS